MALGYTVQSRFVDHANFMSSGFDHTSQLAFSHNAAAGRLLGLSEQQIANAIAMAAVSDASFAVVRAKPLSQWKGLASAQSALGSMNTLFLARRGVEGPLQVIEGPLGIDHLLRMKINIDWDKQGYEGVSESTIKKYNSMIHTQSAVHCMVELAGQNKIDPSKVVSIEAEVFQLAYDFAGGGLYGVDKFIRTKEQADHSLPYLLAVALLDGDVMPAQFQPERIARADVQTLLKKVSVRPNQEYTAQYPAKMPAKITVRLRGRESDRARSAGLSGTRFPIRSHGKNPSRSSIGSWPAVPMKRCAGEIKDAVRSLENIQVRDLMKLLGAVKASQPAPRHPEVADEPKKGEMRWPLHPTVFARSSRDLRQGDGAAFFEHVADKVDWIVMGTHPLPVITSARRHSSQGTFAKLGKVLPQGAELHPEHLIVKDDEAVVELHSLATAKNGMRFDNRYCWVVYFRDELIVRVRAYLDSAMVARLFEENPIDSSGLAAA